MIKKEEKFFVIKQSDIDEFYDRHLSTSFPAFLDDKAEQVSKWLTFLIADINKERIRDNKKIDNKYIVCNQDEPYAELVWQIILQGERDKELRRMIKIYQNQVYGKV